MLERGFEPEFPSSVRAEVGAMAGPPAGTEEPTRDLRDLLWCSIDNDDSRDLDQLSVAEQLKSGDVRIIVAVADVDAAVSKGSACDRHAANRSAPWSRRSNPARFAHRAGNLRNRAARRLRGFPDP